MPSAVNQNFFFFFSAPSFIIAMLLASGSVSILSSSSSLFCNKTRPPRPSLQYLRPARCSPSPPARLVLLRQRWRTAHLGLGTRASGDGAALLCKVRFARGRLPAPGEIAVLDRMELY